MKKFLLVCLFLLVLSPVSAKAAAISSQSLSGKAIAERGEEITVTFELDFAGIDNTEAGTEGVWQIAYQVIFDENVFVLESVKSDSFNTALGKENGINLIFSVVTEGAPNTCVYGGQLYCGKYKSTMTFLVKNTNETKSKIEIGAIVVGFLNMNDPDKEYTEEDIDPVTTTSYASHTVKINQSNSKVETPSNSTNNSQSTTSSAKPSTSVSQSSNALLKSLNVENYDIKFDTYLLDYTVEVDDNVNNLTIKVEPEDNKATYKVIGADDLQKNENKVLIEVTAENGDKKTYTINTRTKKEETKKIKTEAKEEDQKEKVTVNKKFVTYIIIFFGGIVGLVIIGFIISKIKNRKLNKMLDQL